MESNVEPWRWELPDLTGEKILHCDTETTGLDVWGEDLPVGMSVWTEDGRSWYVPWAHREGFNYDQIQALAWCKDNLRGKDLWWANAKFDNHMMLKVGVDLEALGCRLHDVQYWAALIDERMKKYNLEDLAWRFLGKHKVKLEGATPIHERSSEGVRPYAEYDARLVGELKKHFVPILEREELTKVQQLEDDLIYATCEMERNGLPLDMDKLVSWEMLCRRRYQELVLSIHREVGFRVEPSKPKDLARLLHHFKIEFQETETGLPSITGEDLKRSSEIPAIKLAFDARQMHSIETKYLSKYLKAVGSDGILRYSLNQLRASSEEGGGEFGTVSGRYSASSPFRNRGANPQQVYSEKNQKKQIGDMFIIRELFVETTPGYKFFSADASQIEFRIFAHYCNDERLIHAYRTNPKVDFHEVVRLFCGIEGRRPAKDINFGRAYGMGKEKMRRKMAEEGISADVADRAFAAWDEHFPKGKQLIYQASDLAKSRGYIKTWLGRRRRYSKDETRYYTAWNHVGQGTAADIMKLVILDTYNCRKDLDVILRLTVHDELCGGARPENQQKFQEFLDVQRIQLKVPITWNLKIGDNWRL